MGCNAEMFVLVYIAEMRYLSARSNNVGTVIMLQMAVMTVNLMEKQGRENAGGQNYWTGKSQLVSVVFEQ